MSGDKQCSRTPGHLFAISLELFKRVSAHLLLEGFYLDEQFAVVISGYQRIAAHIELALLGCQIQSWQAGIFAKRSGGFSDH